MPVEDVVARCLGLLRFRRLVFVDIVQCPIPKDAPGVFEEPERFQIRQGFA